MDLSWLKSSSTSKLSSFIPHFWTKSHLHLWWTVLEPFRSMVISKLWAWKTGSRDSSNASVHHIWQWFAWDTCLSLGIQYINHFDGCLGTVHYFQIGPIPWLCMQQSARFTHALHQQHSRLSTENQAVTSTFTLRGQQILYHDAHTHTCTPWIPSFLQNMDMSHVQQMETLLDTQTSNTPAPARPWRR